ncbi:Glycoside hydrolase protein [Lasiodiplodia theobromae]|uniref:Glycoside hydrolase protein n=1 Tax=Lasiodiplodia theobromae TaxID=45133 RepID=UPI0015C33AB0|nr:Glycoside hydrolase protein [Lasiodiplodia theobromae]KAF4536410.1 Glycoside hydrolase protein [Lasiodiplodia theobromae]
MKPINNLAILCAAVVTAAPTADDASITIRWSPKQTAGNATPVNKGYIGFGIEMKSFPDYAGRDKPNEFSNFLLRQIADRTGGAPLHIRVGGTSMDNTVYNPAFTADAVNITGDQEACRLHTDTEIGKPWFRSFKNLAPKLAPHYTVQVPLARKNVDNGIKFANACIEALTSSDETPDGVKLSARLDAIEIGNEPNFYTNDMRGGCPQEKDRQDGWGPSEYASEWTKYAKRLAEGVGALKRSGTKDWFQALTLSSNVENRADWGLSAIGNELNDGGYVKTVSQHYYQGVATKVLKEELLNHSITVSRMQDNFGANIESAKNRKIPFILGEVGSAIAPHDDDDDINPNLYDTLGGALWTLDFLLHGMTLGIARVSMQLGTNFRMSAWQPVKSEKYPKAVRGNYYGLIAGAEFIGGNGDLQIRPLAAVEGHPNMVGYAGYHGGKLSKIAVLNLQVWNDGDRDRPVKKVSLDALGDDVNKVRVSRLSASMTTASAGITWAGKGWVPDGTEFLGGEKPFSINVKDGFLAKGIEVKASEAVVIEILRG